MTTLGNPLALAGPGPGNQVSRATLFLALGVVAILIILIVPLPPFLLDILISFNIGLSFLIMLVILNISSPLEFHTFPSLLLFTTLLRLSLNVASTRLILLYGNPGTVIKAFGDFVVGGNYVVGMVVFLILVIIQFVVITKGATRISEVAARFTLDAMPGKQMAIDADLNAGLITNEEAIERRDRIQREAEFFGAMDGASKFVRGDAVAGLIITAINIVGGILVGWLNRGLAPLQAMQIYTILTVGDGLVSQIPSLVLSTSAGVLVTKAATKEAMAGEVTRQFTAQPRAILSAAGLLLLLGLIPGLPFPPFAVMSAVLFAIWLGIKKEGEEEEAREKAAQEAEERALPPGGPAPTVDEVLQVDRLGIEIGYRLIGLVEPGEGGGLLEQIGNMRRQFASRTGVIVPPIRVKDNIQLQPNSYRILLGGQEVGRGELRAGHYLAMNPGGGDVEIEGIETVEPAFGLPGKWITATNKAQAELSGYTVIDAVSVLVTHLTEILKRHAFELLTRDDVKAMLDAQKKLTPAVVEEVVPGLLTVGQVQKVLASLLKEQVSIRNLGLILEALADGAMETKDLRSLTEEVRRRLARSIVEPFLDEEGTLWAVTLDQTLERTMADAVVARGGDLSNLPPGFLGKLVDSAAAELQKAIQSGHEPVLLTRAALRPFLAETLLAAVPGGAVLSYQEAAVARKIESIGTVRLETAGVSS